MKNSKILSSFDEQPTSWDDMENFFLSISGTERVWKITQFFFLTDGKSIEKPLFYLPF